MSIKKLASETAIYGITSIVGRFLYFLLTPLYANVIKEVFPTEEYGVMSHLFSIIGIVLVLFTYRIESAYFRFGTESKEQEQNAFNVAGLSIVSTTLFLAMLLLPFANELANFLDYGEYSYLIRIALGIIIVDALCEIPYAKLRLEQRPIRFASIRMAGILINLFLNLFFILFCPYALQNEAWSFLHPILERVYFEEYLLIYPFLANLIGNGFSLLLLTPTMARIRWSQFDFTLWKRMMTYAFPLIIVGISYVFNEMFDRFIMRYWLIGSDEYRWEQIGIYSACYKFAMFLALFTQAFRYGAEPFFFRQRNEENAREIYAKVAKYFTLISAVGFLVILLYLDVLKLFIVGEEYWVGLKIVPIILLANLCLGIYYNLSIWYKLTDLTKWGAVISVIGAVITIGLNYILLPIYGYIGAAWTTLICYATMLVISYVLGKRKYPIPYEVGNILGYIALAIAAYALSEWLQQLMDGTLWKSLLLNTVILFGYLGVLFWREKGELKSL